MAMNYLVAPQPNQRAYMNLIKNGLIAIILVSSITACTDPKDTVLPSDISTWESNKNLKNSVQKLTDEEKKLLAAYAMRAGLSTAFGGKGINEGTTIGEAINIQSQWLQEQQAQKAKQEALAAELQKKQLEKLKEMNSFLTVSLNSLGFQPSNAQKGQYQDYFTIELGFKNNTDKNISGAKGIVILKDMFGEVIKTINLSNDNNIPAKQVMTLSGTIDYNQFIDQDKKLKSTKFEKLQFEWVPDVYIFENGDKFVMPQS
ncbi:hypothetical protein [Photobacterium leiognathi]|uniref:hypothetical protein n=1 Tax=Photobacterium leiognathi TaxID=553611 RepID=UPI0029818D48|nr:hypothetical protein [Photobacterium leiognathi]